MKNSDMPAMPTFEINETCGFDGNSGPDLVQTINTGLTKREYAAIKAMQGFSVNADVNDRDEKIVARWSVEQADALLAELDKDV